MKLNNLGIIKLDQINRQCARRMRGLSWRIENLGVLSTRAVPLRAEADHLRNVRSNIYAIVARRSQPPGAHARIKLVGPTLSYGQERKLRSFYASTAVVPIVKSF